MSNPSEVNEPGNTVPIILSPPTTPLSLPTRLARLRLLSHSHSATTSSRTHSKSASKLLEDRTITIDSAVGRERSTSAPPNLLPKLPIPISPRTPATGSSTSSPANSIPTSPRKLSTPSPSHYQITPVVLGRGSFSTVRQALDPRTRKVVAVKEVDLRQCEDKYAVEEKALSLLRHQNIVQFYESERLGAFGYLFMECLQHPSLHDAIENRSFQASEENTFSVINQLHAVLSYLHGKQIAHRDFKSDNISFSPRECQITVFDFGLCWFNGTETGPDVFINDVVGSPVCMPPEMLLRKPYNPFAADTWALGIILYEMLYSSSPHDACHNLEELSRLYKESLHPISFPTLDGFPPSHPISLIQKGVLTIDPQMRWDLARIGLALIDQLKLV